MSENAITVDTARGVDVFKGKKLLLHVSGAHAYEIAVEFAAGYRGSYIRYWAVKS